MNFNSDWDNRMKESKKMTSSMEISARKLKRAAQSLIMFEIAFKRKDPRYQYIMRFRMYRRRYARNFPRTSGGRARR